MKIGSSTTTSVTVPLASTVAVSTISTAAVTRPSVLQYVEIAYLFYRQYYWLPGLLAALTTAAAVSLMRVVQRQNLKMTTLVNQRRLTPVVKGGWVRAVSSHKLVPGDVVVVQRGKAMCDMVVLQGSCLVVESMLSGEVCLHTMLYLLCCAVLCYGVLLLQKKMLSCCGVSAIWTG